MIRRNRKTELVPMSKLYPNAAGRAAGDAAVDAIDAVGETTLTAACVAWLKAYEAQVFEGTKDR